MLYELKCGFAYAMQVAYAMQLLESHDTLSAEAVQIFLRKKIPQKLRLGFKAACLAMLGMLGLCFTLTSCAELPVRVLELPGCLAH